VTEITNVRVVELENYRFWQPEGSVGRVEMITPTGQILDLNIRFRPESGSDEHIYWGKPPAELSRLNWTGLGLEAFTVFREWGGCRRFLLLPFQTHLFDDLGLADPDEAVIFAARSSSQSV
jgi:hypothetical protein